MTAVLEPSALAIPLDVSLEAHEPPEVRGSGRDDVRLLVSNGATDVEHATFRDLPRRFARRRRARREQLGDDPRGDRGHVARRARGACPLLHGAAGRRVAR